VVISGHTHQAYVCEIAGRLVTSGDKYGTLVTTIDLKLDPTTRDIVSAKANNVIVRTGVYAKDLEQTGLIAAYDKLAAPIANRHAGSVTRSRKRCRAFPTMPARVRSAISLPTPSSTPRPPKRKAER
jgi:5'-nucleotidase